MRSDADVAAASQLARDFFAYMRATYPETQARPSTPTWSIQDFEGQLADFRSHFNPPHGECLLARLDGEPAGIVMLKPYAEGVCELNRMYVTRAARGRGLGRALCEALIAGRARSATAQIRLDALNAQVEAVPLYRKLGFRPAIPTRRPTRLRAMPRASISTCRSGAVARCAAFGIAPGCRIG